MGIIGGLAGGIGGGGMLGLAGGAAGTGFAAPSGTNLATASTPEDLAAARAQLLQSQQGTQGGLGNQQALLQALQQQQGLANQSQVYNQLQGVAAGTGPNPAQAMLANATGANVQNQAALMAGQRGAGANPALIARQAAMQGSNAQQQALGQAAAMQAQQSLGALGAAGQMATTQAGQQIGQTNAALAGQMQNQQMQLQNQQQQQQAIAAQNQAKAGIQSSINEANAGLAKTTMGGQQKLLGGLMNSGGAMAALSKGGSVPGQASHRGNNYANDTVDAKLSPGELVVDRETMADPGIAGNAARLLAALIEAKNKGAGGGNKLAKGGFADNPELKESVTSSWEDLKNTISQAGSQEAFDESMSSLPKSPGEAIAQEMTGGQPINQESVAGETQTDRLPATQAAPVAEPKSAPAQAAMPEAKPELANAPQVDQAPQAGLAPKQAQAVQPAPSAPPEQTETPAAQPVAATPQAPQVQMGPKTFEQHKQDTANELQVQQQTFQNDVDTGKIHPKTYSEMFKNKSTLGKVGMIFGMLMSGAGSALAGQQNAFLSAMDKEIENDFEAQKQNQAGKMNQSKLSQEKLMNEAKIKEMVFQGKLNEAQAKHLIVDSNIKSDALYRTKMNSAVLHNLTLQAQKYPVGSPDRMKAEQTLASLNGIVKDENFNLLDRAAVASAYNKSAYETTGKGGKQSQADYMSQMKAMEKINPEKAKSMRAHLIPGVGVAGVDVTPEVRGSFDTYRVLNNTIEQAKKFQEEHKTFGTFKGTAANDRGDSLTKNMMLQVGVLEKLGALASEDLKLMKGLVPPVGSVFDSKTKAKLDELQNMVNTRVDSLKTSYAVEPFPETQAQSQGQSLGKEEIKVVNGVKYKRGPNGEAIPVQ